MFGKSRKDEAAAESTRRASKEEDAPPSYDSKDAKLPTYEDITETLCWLKEGDPEETVSVPMLLRKDSVSLHRLNPFSRKGYENTPHYISVRKMKREMYLQHYAKDIDGNYCGTSNPAPDATLVFVPGKSTPLDLLKQLDDTAYGMQQRRGL